MNAKQLEIIKKMLNDIRYASSQYSLSYANGKMQGFLIGAEVDSLTWLRLFGLVTNAQELRFQELVEAARMPAFIRDQAA